MVLSNQHKGLEEAALRSAVPSLIVDSIQTMFDVLGLNGLDLSTPKMATPDDSVKSFIVSSLSEKPEDRPTAEGGRAMFVNVLLQIPKRPDGTPEKRIVGKKRPPSAEGQQTVEPPEKAEKKTYLTLRDGSIFVPKEVWQVFTRPDAVSCQQMRSRWRN